MSDPFSKKDVRWRQRFQNYRQALSRLTDGVAQSRQRPLSELENLGLIQTFKFTHELAWNVLKDFLEENGITEIMGAKGTIREAFKNGLVPDGQPWMDMIIAREKTSAAYNTPIANDLVNDILARFYPNFLTMESRFLKWE